MIIYNSNIINGLNYGSTDFGKIYYHNNVCYQKVSTPKNYFRFVSLADGMKFKNSNFQYQYSLDGGKTWTLLNYNTYSPTINSGETIYWKANHTTPSSSGYGIGTFKTLGEGLFDVEGNIMSLIYGDDFEGKTTISSGHFERMFLYNTSLRSASNLILPPTTNSSCYLEMFDGCTSLIAAPTLPATTLANACYKYMFDDCTSLTTAPMLPATTLAENCYSYMFLDCTSLNSITCLATNISAFNCTTGWVNRVASSGTFYKDPSMTAWTVSTSGTPSGWTVENYNPTPQTLQWVTYNNGDTIPSDLQIYGIKGLVNDLNKVFYMVDDDIYVEDVGRNKFNVHVGGFTTECYSEYDILSDTSVEYIFSNIGCSDYYTVSSKTIANTTNGIQLYIY